MPVRRLHNYVYCPRLFYLQWVENIFVEDANTVAGTHAHRNTDKASPLKESLDLEERSQHRSLAVSSDSLGLTGVVDLVESTADGREIVDYKNGSARRHHETGERIAKDNDAIQLAAYALLLGEANLPVDRASIYYAADRSRVPVELDDKLFARCKEKLAEARRVADETVCPPPLLDDARCLHCSAYSVCLPKESAFWGDPTVGQEHAIDDKVAPRPPGDEGEIVVVQNPRAKVACRGGEIQVRLLKEVLTKHPIHQIQAVYLYGGVQISTQAVQSLLSRHIPIGYFSPAGRFLGMTSGLPQSGVDARLGQARLFENRKIRATIARECIRAKIHNQRVLLMRNGSPPKPVLKELARIRDRCQHQTNLDSIRGLEGAAAALYFEHFATMVKGSEFEEFDFNGRNRRPPRDPINSLLSQGYSILAKEITGMAHAVGLDPFIGFFHQPRYGRPALALDLMEEFRPLIADSVVVSLINRRELEPKDFQFTARGVFLSNNGRRQFWRAWFRRLDTEVKHPQFGYRMSYRRMLDVQARQFWRVCRGDVPTYHGFTTR